MMLGLPSDHVERIAMRRCCTTSASSPCRPRLLRKGPLTREEWAVMSEHPIVGERILARTRNSRRSPPIVRHEHEHWDGTGYPDRLRQRIPIGSRDPRVCTPTSP
jgi:hypothetical protein